MNWKNKLLLITTVLVVSACASNTQQETKSSKSDNSEKDSSQTLIAKNGIIYNYGAQNLDKSQVVTIINKTQDTTITSFGSEKVPHPLFGSQYKKFMTAAGIRYFNIRFRTGDAYISGSPKLVSRVEAGKTYEFISDTFGNSIKYFLVDIDTKKKSQVGFVK